MPLPLTGAEKTMFLKFSLDLVHKLMKSDMLQVCHEMSRMLSKVMLLVFFMAESLVLKLRLASLSVLTALFFNSL